MFYKVLILDLDGTVYLDGKPIKNVVSQLNRFREIVGNRVLFLTNNTSVGTRHYYEKLTDLGFVVEYDDIISPIKVSGDYLSKKFSSGYILGTSDTVREYKELFGLRHNNLSPEFVLVTFDKELTYKKLEEACKFINQGIPFYTTHIDLACPSVHGPIPDCGSITGLIETTTKRKPLMDFGKPSIGIAEFIRAKIGHCKNEEVLMVGDRLYTDIALGNILNVDTLLVGTGESKYSDYLINSTFIVDYFSESLSDFLDTHSLKIFKL